MKWVIKSLYMNFKTDLLTKSHTTLQSIKTVIHVDFHLRWWEVKTLKSMFASVNFVTRVSVINVWLRAEFMGVRFLRSCLRHLFIRNMNLKLWKRHLNLNVEKYVSFARESSFWRVSTRWNKWLQTAILNYSPSFRVTVMLTKVV